MDNSDVVDTSGTLDNDVVDDDVRDKGAMDNSSTGNGSREYSSVDKDTDNTTPGDDKYNNQTGIVDSHGLLWGSWGGRGYV